MNKYKWLKINDLQAIYVCVRVRGTYFGKKDRATNISKKTISRNKAKVFQIGRKLQTDRAKAACFTFAQSETI